MNARHPVFANVELPTDRTLLMGIVNVTPDSFSDGGKWFGVDQAIERGLQLVAQGADIIDVGGESTRPNSTRISAEEELGRIEKVVEALVEEGVVVSVDTLHAKTAAAVCKAGAHIINDVSGGRWDADMPRVMADSDAVCILQHWRGLPGAPDEKILTSGSIDTVLTELDAQVEDVLKAGVKRERIVVDPGLGFAKTADASWSVIAGLREMMSKSEFPILIGHSRKRFVQTISDELASPDEVTAALTALVAAEGAWAVRVHEARGNLAAIRAGSRWLNALMTDSLE
ncbi:MAG: dihydropteroate synthase [Actinomycetaceae bacterium]|nr:dihydropteroate synthase [Actinomycetaceae bacterium]